MTQSDDSRDDPGTGPHEGRAEPDLPFDEEAAWRMIVENYGERPSLADISTHARSDAGTSTETIEAAST